MDTIIRRLLENKNKEYLSTEVFNSKNAYSDEAEEFSHEIDMKLMHIPEDIRSDANMDDMTLIVNGRGSVTYKCKIFSDFVDGAEVPLNKRVARAIESYLSSVLIFPEDEEYTYSVKVEIWGTSLNIRFSRESKDW